MVLYNTVSYTDTQLLLNKLVTLLRRPVVGNVQELCQSQVRPVKNISGYGLISEDSDVKNTSTQ